MKTLADRFRHWYEYERDCNAKTLTMLGSVPAERRNTPDCLADDAEHLPAGSHDSYVWARGQNANGKFGARGEDMFAVVHDQQ